MPQKLETVLKNVEEIGNAANRLSIFWDRIEESIIMMA